MIIAVACDHAGFPMKKVVIDAVLSCGHSVLDFGTDSTDPVDYPDYAEKLGRSIQQGDAARGILLCGSGVGAAVAANKMRGIRAGVCHDIYSAHQCVEHDNVNVLALGARIIGPALIRELVCAYLGAVYSQGERHERRLKKVLALEAMEAQGSNP